MDLVRSEYAEEAAVLFAWLSALLPWSLTYGTPAGSRYVVIRFPFLMYENLAGLAEELDGTRLVTPIDALERSVSLGLTQTFSSAELESRYGTTDVSLTIETVSDALATSNGGQVLAYLTWTFGVVVLFLAVALSVLMYVEADVLDTAPVDAVRLMGLLLGVVAVSYVAATVLLYRNFPGTLLNLDQLFLPLGPMIYVVFAGVLLTVDR
ncbi:hypothetical protein [Halostella sp. PRR32]|uniref:DUF7549 family protein n=1 Tax=Halostella sp. PRR32 TaxID=3098147 RepID=UPI00110D8D86|nr:hypothetical protein [Halostella sp. PRR32]